MKIIDYQSENELLKQQNAVLENEIRELKKMLEILREQISLARHKRFGASTEQSDTAQLTLFGDDIFNESETESDLSIQAPEVEEIIYRRRKQKGKREQDFSAFPVERVEYGISDNECICPDCGAQMKECGHNTVRKELKVIPKQFIVVEHVQKVYFCRHCEQNGIEVPMLKAGIPNPLISGSGIVPQALLRMW